MAKAKQKSTRTKKPKSGKPDWVKDVLGKWADAAGKNDCDPFGLDEAPEWVLNAWVECCKIVFPSGLPAPDKWDGKFLGEFFGRFYALENMYAGAVPLGSETQAEKEKVEAAAKKLPPLKNAKALEKDFLTKFKATREAIPLATLAATSASYQDAIDFQKGLARGIKIEPEELATSRTFQRHTRTFYVLALFWRFWVTCKSLREIYGYLCKAVGEQKIGSFKTFENRIAKKIGLTVRKRGRPSGKK